MKRLVLFIIIAVLTLAAVLLVGNSSNPATATDQETLQIANQLYGSGDFAGAAQLYQQLVDSGIQNADLYYNLGSSYIQLEDTGRAILNFERAQRLAPRDAAIDAALQQALNQVDGRKTTGSPLDQLVSLAQSNLTLNELALLALAAVFTVLCLWQVSRSVEINRIKQVASLALIASVLWLGVNVLTLAAILYSEQTHPIAIMLTEAPVGGLNLASGTEVKILQHRGETVLISLPGRNVEGWVSAASIEAV